jgi:hypothetical protein
LSDLERVINERRSDPVRVVVAKFVSHPPPVQAAIGTAVGSVIGNFNPVALTSTWPGTSAGGGAMAINVRSSAGTRALHGHGDVSAIGARSAKHLAHGVAMHGSRFLGNGGRL